jgi:hypothetical protein
MKKRIAKTARRKIVRRNTKRSARRSTRRSIRRSTRRTSRRSTRKITLRTALRSTRRTARRTKSPNKSPRKSPSKSPPLKRVKGYKGKNLRFDGYYKNNQRYEGSMFYEDGKLEYEGTFKDDKYNNGIYYPKQFYSRKGKKPYYMYKDGVIVYKTTNL